MRFTLPAVVLICVIVSACGREAVDAYAKVQAQRSPLIDGFESYATGSEIREKLKEIGEIAVVIEESHLPPRGYSAKVRCARLGGEGIRASWSFRRSELPLEFRLPTVAL
jgi:hypothetical protein